MKTHRILIYGLVIGSAAVMPACKSKKVLAKAAEPQQVAPVASAPVQAAPVSKPAPVAQEVMAAPAKADLNFSNIQFDFNSAVLRTDAYENLDHIALQMKLSPGSRFEVNGFASAEGSPSHNIRLSADRANAVRAYLSNAGIDVSRLATKGYGEEKPVASNSTETGRGKNRRVEVRIINS